MSLGLTAMREQQARDVAIVKHGLEASGAARVRRHAHAVDRDGAKRIAARHARQGTPEAKKRRRFSR